MRPFLFAAALILCSTAAKAAPPTAQSVQTLLEVTQAESMLDQAYASVEQMIRQGMSQQLAGQTLTDEQRRTIELAPAKLAQLMKTELNWATLRPIYIAIYQESFEQAEIDGLIAFYRSPVGQSFVSKMPAVMNRTMGVMQTQLQSLMPKIGQAMEEVMREAKIPPKT